MENEQTAAQLLEARAEADERIKDRVAFLKTRIDSDRAELATLGIKRVRADKPKRGRPRGSRNLKLSEPANIVSPLMNIAPNAATKEGL